MLQISSKQPQNQVSVEALAQPGGEFQSIQNKIQKNMEVNQCNNWVKTVVICIQNTSDQTKQQATAS